MPAYVVFGVTWSDAERIEEYSQLAYPTLVAAGGKIIAYSDRPESLEGDWQPGMIGVIEFPSAETARTWINSPGYQPALEIRTKFVTSNLILVGD